MGNATAMCSGSRFEELEEKIEEQEKTIAELRRQSTMIVGEKDAEVESLKRRLQELHDEVAETRQASEAQTAAEIEARENKIVALDGRIGELEERLEEAQRERAENEARKLEIESRDEELRRMGAQTQDLTEQLARMRENAERSAASDARVAELEAELAGTEAEVKRLQEEQAEAERLRSEYEAHKARVAELEPKVASLSTMLEQREEELARIQKQSEERRAEMEDLSSRIGELQGQAASANEARTALTLTRSQIEELQVELEAKRRIEAEVQRMQREMADQKKALQHERRRSMQLEAKMQVELLGKFRCFGVPIDAQLTEEVPGYASEIPRVLVLLRKHLVEGGGLDKVGIFRLAPKQEDIEQAKDQLNVGAFEGTADVSTVANLVGAWFRELPEPVLKGIDTKKVLKASKPKDAWKLVEKQVKEPRLSVFRWLVTLGAEVAARSDVNRMTPKNLAIVFAPNVFEMPDVTPEMSPDKAMEMMSLIKQFSVFVELCIQQQQQQK